MSKRLAAAMVVACLACFALPGVASAGKWVLVYQGINTRWEYRPDASDYSYLSSGSTSGGGGASSSTTKPSQPLGQTAPAYVYIGNGNWRLQGTTTVVKEGTRTAGGAVFQNGRWVKPGSTVKEGTRTANGYVYHNGRWVKR